MALQPSAEETLSLRHGFRYVPENGVKLEEVLLAVRTNVSARVAVFFASGLALEMCSSNEVCEGRLFVVKSEINNRRFVLINVYAPKTGRERWHLFWSLRQEISQVAPEETGGR